MLKITRIKRFKDSLRAFEIWIDGKRHGHIKNGQTIEIELENGPHFFKLSLDWCTSNIESFTYMNGGDIVYVCYPTSVNKVRSITMGRSSYIILDKK